MYILFIILTYHDIGIDDNGIDYKDKDVCTIYNFYISWYRLDYNDDYVVTYHDIGIDYNDDYVVTYHDIGIDDNDDYEKEGKAKTNIGVYIMLYLYILVIIAYIS